MRGILLEIKDVKKYLKTERDKAKSELKDTKNNAQLHGRYLAFFELFEWIDKKEIEERNEKNPTEATIS